MAKHKIKDPKAILCLFLFVLFLGAVIGLFITGGIFFSQEHPKVLHYANSMCQVDSSSYKYYTCESRYYVYTCYGPIWEVHHGAGLTISARVEQQTRYRDYRDALNKANEYQVGSTYPCWYDTRNPAVAQWDKPSTVIATILLCCGGASVLLAGLFLYLAIKLVKQEIDRSKEMNMDPYSNPNFISKY